MSEDWAAAIAKEFKQRENPNMMIAILGIVITPPPNIEISILNGTVMIRECYILENLLKGFTRIVTIPEQETSGKGIGKGETDIIFDGGVDAQPHSHNVTTEVTIQSIGMSNAEIQFQDTLQSGDEVLLIVSPDNQTYFIIGKVKKIGDV